MRAWIGRRALALGGLAGAMAAAAARAETARPLRLVVPYGPGAGADALARRLARGMAERLGGLPVVVDNRPGGATLLAAEHVAAAAPDGLTLLVAPSTTFAANPQWAGRADDLLEKLQPVTLLVRTPLALYASAGFGARDMVAVLDGARAAPDPLQYGITARGDATHLTGEVLQQATGIALQDVPYRATGLIQQGLLRGDIPLAIDGIGGYAALASKGALNVIAITGTARSPLLPQAPTFAEVGIAGLERPPWYGLLAPAGLDPEVLAGLHAAVVGALRDPALRETLAREGAAAETQSPAAFAALIGQETAAWDAVARRVESNPD